MSEQIPRVRTKVVRLSESIDSNIFFLQEEMTIEEFIRQLGEKFITIYPNAESVDLIREEDYVPIDPSNTIRFTITGIVPVVSKPGPLEITE